MIGKNYRGMKLIQLQNEVSLGVHPLKNEVEAATPEGVLNERGVLDHILDH